jgi:hypothetical protein
MFYEFRIRFKEFKYFFIQKIVSKHAEYDPDFFPIPYSVVKKASDFGSVFATMVIPYVPHWNTLFLHMKNKAYKFFCHSVYRIYKGQS